jgi:hypothetical protein
VIDDKDAGTVLNSADASRHGQVSIVADALGETGKSRTAPPPLTEIGPAPAPLIVIGSVALLSVKVLAMVIVVGAAKNVGSKVMMAGLVSASALATAAWKLPAPVGLALSTVQVLGLTRSSSNSA